jgi:hypothetical protein
VIDYLQGHIFSTAEVLRLSIHTEALQLFLEQGQSSLMEALTVLLMFQVQMLVKLF